MGAKSNTFRQAPHEPEGTTSKARRFRLGYWAWEGRFCLF
ncbi:hypothetical protein HMPREF0578_0732 [Mobiluncus mulieris 28-1]|nr:hypothetical protein HMPREF0578_0732 [Mobiluncus mulieris 28-1]